MNNHHKNYISFTNAFKQEIGIYLLFTVIGVFSIYLFIYFNMYGNEIFAILSHNEKLLQKNGLLKTNND